MYPMVEIVRKRTQAQAFTQILVAVISGAAAMYCLQNFKSEAPAPEAVQAPAPAAAVPPALPESRLPAPEPSARPAVPKGESAMLVVAEPGGAPPGMLHAAGDDPLTGPAPASPKSGAVRIPTRSVFASPRLRTGGVKPTFGADGVSAEGIGQRFVPLARKPGEKGLQAGAAADFAPAGPPKKVVFAPQPIAKDSRPDLTPAGSLIDPSAPAPKPFWSEDRVLRVGLSGVLALVGIFYMIFQSGLLGAASDERGDRPS